MKDPLFDNLAERFAGHEMDVDPGTWSAISGQLAVVSGSSLSGLLKEKFAGHEAPVDPHVWTNISSQIGQGAAAGAGAAGAGSAAGWWAAGIAATLVAGGLLFYNLSGEPAATGPAAQTQVVATVPVEARRLNAQPTSGAVSLSVPLLSDQRTAPVTPAVNAPKNGSPSADALSDLGSGNQEKPFGPPTEEGKQTVNTVLQDVVDNYVTSPVVVATEPTVPRPTPTEMPSPAVHVDHEEVVVEQPADELELPQAVPAPTLAVMIPTAFSPNDDGVNDELAVTVQNYQKATVRIFSASSNALVFSADNLEAKWNGRMMNSGPLCEPGMYFYALEVTDADGKTWSKGEVVRLFQR